MLRSRNLPRAAAPSPAVACGVIEDNEITGFHMKTHCIGIAPGVSAANKVERNRCPMYTKEPAQQSI
jgi:hypothetical protein